MTNLFFNTEVSSENSSQAEILANLAFSPIRYLFQGRTVEIYEELVALDRQTYVEKNWKKTALAVICLVPGFLVGLVAKLVSYWFTSARLNYKLTKAFYDEPFVPPVLIKRISLDDSHTELEKKYDSIYKRMDSKEIWDDLDFIHEVDDFMREAFQEMLLVYDEFESHYGNDKDKMAEAMVRDFYKYFHASLAKMYHLARGHAYFVEAEGDSKEEKWEFPDLTIEDQKAYFNPQMAQWEWQKLYNTCCQMLDDHGLRERLKDTRTAKLFRPDLGFVAKP